MLTYAKNSLGAESSSQVCPLSEVDVMTHFHPGGDSIPITVHAAVPRSPHVNLQMDPSQSTEHPGTRMH